MKKLTVLITVGLLVAGAVPAYAGITNKDLDADFGFRIVLQYAHNDLSRADGANASTSIPVAGRPDTSAADQNNNEYVMPFSGRVVGISAASNAALTAGSASFDVTINGTANTTARVALNQQLSSSQRNYTNLIDRFSNSTDITFSAGDRIGVVMTAERGVAPTTADVVVTVVVEQEVVE